MHGCRTCTSTESRNRIFRYDQRPEMTPPTWSQRGGAFRDRRRSTFGSSRISNFKVEKIFISDPSPIPRAIVKTSGEMGVVQSEDFSHFRTTKAVKVLGLRWANSEIIVAEDRTARHNGISVIGHPYQRPSMRWARSLR